MKINVSEVGISLLGLSTSELRVINDALGVLQDEAGTGQAYAAEVAERLSAEIPAVIYKVSRYLCKQCRTNFYEDEIRVEKIGAREERVELCPVCESHLIEKVSVTFDELGI